VRSTIDMQLTRYTDARCGHKTRAAWHLPPLVLCLPPERAASPLCCASSVYGPCLPY
jgi:hypothetical protein